MPSMPPTHRASGGPKHTPKRPEKRLSACKRGYDHKWRAKRRAILAETPLCWVCEMFGVISAATDLDHITPHRGDRVKFHGDVQPLCRECHAIKSAHEHAEYMRQRKG